MEVVHGGLQASEECRLVELLEGGERPELGKCAIELFRDKSGDWASPYTAAVVADGVRMGRPLDALHGEDLVQELLGDVNGSPHGLVVVQTRPLDKH